MALTHVLHLLSSPYCFPSYFWESSRQVLSCYSSTPSLLTKGQLQINELNKCSLGTYYVPGTGPVAWTMTDRHSFSNERLSGPSARGHLRLWEHGGPGWGWVWIPGHSQLQVCKGPWTIPPSLQEALAEATHGSPQNGRNAPSLFCDTLCHLDPEATLHLPCEARLKRGPSASSWSNTPSSEPSPPYLTLSNSVPLPTEPAPSYPTGWLVHPTARGVPRSSSQSSFLFCRLSQASRHLHTQMCLNLNLGSAAGPLLLTMYFTCNPSINSMRSGTILQSMINNSQFQKALKISFFFFLISFPTKLIWWQNHWGSLYKYACFLAEILSWLIAGFCSSSFKIKRK